MSMINIFEIPVYNTKLDLNNKSIASYCKKIKKKDKGINVSNLGGWHSTSLNGKHETLNDLFLDIEHHSNLFAIKCGINKKLKLDNIWININSFKDSNQIHFHPNCYFSGVYYVDVPENSGNIEFIHPAEDLLDTNWSNQDKNNLNLFNSSRTFLTSKEGHLLLFPSWLKHLVKPNMTKKERISISFNLE